MLRLLLVLFFFAVLFVSTTSFVGAQNKNKYRHEVLVHLEQGSLLLDARQYELARAEFGKAIELQPKCPDAFNNLGLTYYRVGDLDNAAANYMKALEIEPLFIPSLSNLAAVRYRQGKLSDASNLYRLALRLANDNDYQLHYNLANVLRDDKDYTEAKVHYQQSIKLKPDFASAHNGLGATYYCLSNFSAAEKEVKKAIKLNKQYALAYYHLGLIQSAQNKMKEAMDAYHQSLKYEKNEAYAGDTRQKIKELKKLIASQNTAGTSSSTGEAKSANASRVASFIETNQYKKAEEEIKSLVSSKYKEDPSAWNTYGYVLLMQGDKSKAEASIGNFRKAIELSGGLLIEAHYNLAQAFKTTGRWMSARKECQAAIEQARKQEKMCPLVHNLHGILLKHSGDLKGAESAYRIAIAQSLGKLPVAHYNRALVLEKLQKTREAVKEYQNYLRDAPTGVNARRARSRLKILGY